MARRVFIHCVLVAFLAITVFDLVTGTEHWPFSHYPMYAAAAGRHSTWLELDGESPAGEILIPFSALPPVKDRLATSLATLPPESLDAALAGCLRLYNLRADGPRISALRLYLKTWDLDAGPTPLRTRLLREVH